MSVRRTIVEVSTDGLNVSRFCADLGVSTWLFYDLRRRFAAGGWEAIEPRSRAAHRVVNRTPVELEDLIVEVRKELANEGWDAGADTIMSHLSERYDGPLPLPSRSTIWRVLRRRGFVVPDPSKAPKHAALRFAASRANECWQNDDTGWALADGTPVKIINIIDDCTRVAAACRAVAQCDASAVFDAIALAAAEWGWPERVLNDNAKAHVALENSFAALGITTTHPRPYHPQTCGKVERFHQTVKRYLTAHDPPTTLTELQDQLDAFRGYYNHQRPHRAIARRRPADVWNTTAKSGPANHTLDTPTEIRNVKVAREGIAAFGHRYSIVIGRAYAGQRATIVRRGLSCYVFIDGRAVRALTLNPTRRVQPLNPPSP